MLITLLYLLLYIKCFSVVLLHQLIISVVLCVLDYKTKNTIQIML